MPCPPFNNCIHKDGFDRCRVHLYPKLLRWIAPRGRKPCREPHYRRVWQEPEDERHCPDMVSGSVGHCIRPSAMK